MNSKAIAILVAIAMAVVAIAAGLGSSQAAEHGADETDPVWIVGDKTTAYILKKGETVHVGDSTLPQIDFNMKAFDNPSATFKVASTATAATGEIDTYMWPYAGDELQPLTIAEDTPSGDGKYNVTITANTTDAADGEFFYYFKVDVKRTDVDFGDLTQSIYYAAHVKITDDELKNSVILSTSKTAPENTDSKIKDVVVENVEYQSLEFTRDVSYEGVYAMVKSVTVKDNVETTVPGYPNNSNFDFYAKGLPSGIAMKLDGQIAGKVSASVTPVEKQSFSVYAVNKQTGVGIYLGDFKYSVVNGDGFEYTVDETTYTSSQAGYLVMLNTETKEISLSEEGVTATITKGSEKTPVTVTNNKITISGLGDYTGIIQVQMTKGTNTAILHVMVVGPLVHSGLLPTATSS